MAAFIDRLTRISIQELYLQLIENIKGSVCSKAAISLPRFDFLNDSDCHFISIFNQQLQKLALTF